MAGVRSVHSDVASKLKLQTSLLAVLSGFRPPATIRRRCIASKQIRGELRGTGDPPAMFRADQTGGPASGNAPAVQVLSEFKKMMRSDESHSQ